LPIVELSWGRRLSTHIFFVVAIGCLAAACGGGADLAATTSTTLPAAKPTAIYPGPVGILAGAQPQPNGYLWLLARAGDVADLHQLNLSNGAIASVVPTSLSADAIAQSPSGLIGVGLATLATGALELRNGSSGVLLGTVPIGAPVRDVVAGGDGSTFYVLNSSKTSASVTLVNATTQKVSVTIPVPLDTTSIAVDPLGQNLFALGANGTVNVITTGTGTIAGNFRADQGIQLAMSPTGTELYVLKNLGSGSVSNVSVFRIATESQTRVVGTPAHAVDIQVSADGRDLYAIVGTSAYGNVQVFPSGA
jgi:hypothetical protein